MTDVLQKYWHLLNLYEDYLDDGYRKKHQTPQLYMPSNPIENVPRLDRQDRLQRLNDVAEEVASCTRCKLHTGRNKAVAGEGVLDPLVMCIGEGPGEEEDRSGRPFVGRAGKYLDKWLQAIDLDRRTNSYIGNIVKCRPPNNRDPQPDESAACLPYLERQITLLQPKTILALGRVAAQILTGKQEGIGALRGKTYRYMGVPLIATYHPSGVLRNQDLRRAVWDDLRRLRSLFKS